MKRSALSIIFTVLLLIGMISMLTSCRSSTERTLTAGVRNEVADWSIYSPENDFYLGIEVDLAKALADRLKVSDVRFVPVNPSTRPEKLQSGEVDCVMALFTVTDERRELLDFSQPYYSASTVLYCETSTLFDSIDDVSGGIVGVIRGSEIIEQQLAEVMKAEGLEMPALVRADTFEELSRMLESGEIDAACIDDTILLSLYQEDRVILPTVLGQQDCALAVKKNDEYGRQIAEAMNALIADGTADAIISDWGWQNAYNK